MERAKQIAILGYIDGVDTLSETLSNTCEKNNIKIVSLDDLKSRIEIPKEPDIYRIFNNCMPTFDLPKFKSQKQRLGEIGIHTSDQLKSEYAKIKAKTSNLSRKNRDLIINVVEK